LELNIYYQNKTKDRILLTVLFLYIFFPGSLNANTGNHDNQSASLDIWNSLIYFYNGSFKILNKRFILSYENPSPELEKALTIEAIKKDPRMACVYPARYKYLVNENLIRNQDIFCEDFEEYKKKVPVDQLYYIFASKNYRSITSMMGHGMIATQGINEEGKSSSHSFSFFADLSEYNLAELIYGSFFGGINGGLVLRPLNSELDRYLQKEGRELWQLELNLSTEKKELLKSALWELKEAEPRYLFHKFNCATLLNYTLGIIAPEILEHHSLFTSPLDIYRALQDEGYIKSIQIRYAANTIDQLGSDHQTVQPTSELQDSSVGAYYKHGYHFKFMGASHYFNTPQVGTTSQTALKLGAIDINLSENKIEEVALYEYLDSAKKNGLTYHFFTGYSRSDYRESDHAIANISLSAGKTWRNDTLSVSLLSGLKLQPKDIGNATFESFFSYKLSDYATITKSILYQTDFEKDLYNFNFKLNSRISKNYVFYLGVEKKNPRDDNKLVIFSGIDYYF